MPKSVVIADDHALLARALAAELEQSGYAIAGIAADGIEAIALIKSLRPDGAVLDVSMPGANGAEVFLEARRWSPKTRFMILTGNSSQALLSELLGAGVNGIFLKADQPADISDGFAKILRGQTVVSPSVRRLLASGAEATGLTKRELQVLHGIARGLSNSAIAEELGVSAKTVDTHRTNLMQKMSVHSSSTLLVKAIKLGLIAIDP